MFFGLKRCAVFLKDASYGSISLIVSKHIRNNNENEEHFISDKRNEKVRTIIFLLGFMTLLFLL